MRDDFSAEVRRNLAARAGYKCSICQKSTIGPAAEPSAVLSDGVAAHITAASTGGPRFDTSLSPKERRSEANGIWTCTQHGREIDADTPAFSVELLKGLKNLREDAARRDYQSKANSTDQSERLIEVPYATTAFKLFEIIAPQPYNYSTASALREHILQAKEPARILELAADVIPSVWGSHANIAGILSTLLSINCNIWQPSEPVLSKLERLCDYAVESGDWSRIAAVEPLAFALGAKGNYGVHRRVLERLIEESHWRDADGTRVREYYGTTGIQITSILRHWRDPFRKGLLRLNDIPRLMDLLLSADRALEKGPAQQTVLALLDEHAIALKDVGEDALARRVGELVTALRHITKR